MSEALDVEYLTVTEAAKTLRVSVSTIWRWIGHGQLPAYRVGQRKVRVKSTDLAALITPARESEEQGDAMVEAHEERERLARPLTDEEKERALAAMDAVEELDQQILARHGLERFTPSSTELLNESRDERTRQLA